MNNKMITIGALARRFGCWNIRNNPNGAAYAEDYGDSSETKTKQEIKQKNEGKAERQPTLTVQITTFWALLKTD